MLDALQRLAVPFVLLIAVIAATVALDRVGNEDLPDVDTTSAGVPDGPVTPVFSIRRAPELLTSPRANDDLRAALQAWTATLPPDSCFVVNAAGERIFDHNPSLPLTPASNMKLLTATAALEELGADYRFTTTIAAVNPPDENGVLAGDLYVIGGGDPVLMTDAYADVQPPEDNPTRTRAEELADQAVAANLSTIQGSVLVDETRYDDERAVSSWPTRFLEDSEAGSLSAALLDDGFVGLAEGYASQRGTDSPPPLPRSSDPAALFAASFDDLLEARNVVITSRAAEAVETPPDLVELTALDSPPLSEIIGQMLVNSDNTTAEMLIKELGYVAGGGVTAGNTTSGTLAMSDSLDSLGLPDVGLFALDGSGLSSDNKVTCDLIASALDTTHKDVLRAAMPVAGQSGTLVDAFVGTSFDGRLQAKTGFLAQSSSLSGYFVTDPGVELTFSLIVNVTGDDSISPEDVVGFQEALPEILSSYPEGPPLEELGPRGVAGS